MLSKVEFEDYCRRLNIPKKGIAYLTGVRSSAPSRARSNGTNVVARFPSRKMGMTIQAEAHTTELVLVRQMESSPEVLEFWDQPNRIPLSYTSANGRAVKILHTPDYLVMKKGAVVWVECKPQDGIVSLSEKMPERYKKGDDGSGIALRANKWQRNMDSCTKYGCQHLKTLFWIATYPF